MRERPREPEGELSELEARSLKGPHLMTLVRLALRGLFSLAESVSEPDAGSRVVWSSISSSSASSMTVSRLGACAERLESLRRLRSGFFSFSSSWSSDSASDSTRINLVGFSDSGRLKISTSSVGSWVFGSLTFASSTGDSSVFGSSAWVCGSSSSGLFDGSFRSPVDLFVSVPLTVDDSVDGGVGWFTISGGVKQGGFGFCGNDSP